MINDKNSETLKWNFVFKNRKSILITVFKMRFINKIKKGKNKMIYYAFIFTFFIYSNPLLFLIFLTRMYIINPIIPSPIRDIIQLKIGAEVVDFSVVVLLPCL